MPAPFYPWVYPRDQVPPGGVVGGPHPDDRCTGLYADEMLERGPRMGRPDNGFLRSPGDYREHGHKTMPDDWGLVPPYYWTNAEESPIDIKCATFDATYVVMSYECWIDNDEENERAGVTVGLDNFGRPIPDKKRLVALAKRKGDRLVLVDKHVFVGFTVSASFDDCPSAVEVLSADTAVVFYNKAFANIVGPNGETEADSAYSLPMVALIRRTGETLQVVTQASADQSRWGYRGYDPGPHEGEGTIAGIVRVDDTRFACSFMWNFNQYAEPSEEWPEGTGWDVDAWADHGPYPSEAADDDDGLVFLDSKAVWHTSTIVIGRVDGDSLVMGPPCHLSKPRTEWMAPKPVLMSENRLLIVNHDSRIGASVYKNDLGDNQYYETGGPYLYYGRILTLDDVAVSVGPPNIVSLGPGLSGGVDIFWQPAPLVKISDNEAIVVLIGRFALCGAWWQASAGAPYVHQAWGLNGGTTANLPLAFLVTVDGDAVSFGLPHFLDTAYEVRDTYNNSWGKGLCEQLYACSLGKEVLVSWERNTGVEFSGRHDYYLACVAFLSRDLTSSSGLRQRMLPAGKRRPENVTKATVQIDPYTTQTTRTLAATPGARGEVGYTYNGIGTTYGHRLHFEMVPFKGTASGICVAAGSSVEIQGHRYQELGETVVMRGSQMFSRPTDLGILDAYHPDPDTWWLAEYYEWYEGITEEEYLYSNIYDSAARVYVYFGCGAQEPAEVSDQSVRLAGLPVEVMRVQGSSPAVVEHGSCHSFEPAETTGSLVRLAAP